MPRPEAWAREADRSLARSRARREADSSGANRRTVGVLVGFVVGVLIGTAAGVYAMYGFLRLVGWW